MSFVHQRAGALLLALCTIAGVALWAPPRAEAATCQAVPVATPGTDIAINGEPYRVPGISGVVLCVDQGSVPVPRVSTEGRTTCQFACLSITVPAGSIDAPGATISFEVDDVVQTHPIEPEGAPGPGEACLLSVGGPDAPYPVCKPGVSIGPDIGDPTPGVLTFVQAQVQAAEQIVNEAVADGVETATKAVEDALALVASFEDDVAALQQYVADTAEGLEAAACSSIPPAYETDSWGYQYEVRFCDDAARWARAVASSLDDDVRAWEQYVRDTAAYLTDTACNAIPPMYSYDPWGYGYPVYFCDDPVQWTTIAAAGLVDSVEPWRQFVEDLVAQLVPTTCNAVPPMYEEDPWWGYREVRFCDDPVRWTNVATSGLVRSTCTTVPPMWDESGWPVYFCDDPVRWTTIALKPVRDAVGTICVQPRCIDPVTIYFLLAKLQHT